MSLESDDFVQCCFLEKNPTSNFEGKISLFPLRPYLLTNAIVVVSVTECPKAKMSFGAFT
jgi:hypothetical protein